MWGSLYPESTQSKIPKCLETSRNFIPLVLNSSGEKVVSLQLQIPQVPKDPEHQADEDEERPRQHEEVPGLDGSGDPHQEDDEAHRVHEDGEEEEEQAAAAVGGIIHDRRGLGADL